MGADIAAWAAMKGKSVTLGDVEHAPLGRAVSQARKICKNAHFSAPRSATRSTVSCLTRRATAWCRPIS